MRRSAGGVGFFCALAVLCVAAGAGTAADPRLALLLVIGAALLVVSVTNAEQSAALLLVLSLVLLRPSVAGAQLNYVGIVMAIAAGVLAGFHDSQAAATDRASKASRAMLLWVGLLWLWILVLSSRAGAPFVQNIKGAFGVIAVLAAALVVLRSPTRERTVLRGIVGLILALCASWLISAALWVAIGPTAGALGDLPVHTATGEAAAQVFFPGSLVRGLTAVGGVRFSRFVLFLREPGLAQAVIVWAYFMLPRIGWNTRGRRALLLAGVVGTLSTTGLGVFAIAWVLQRYILNPKPGEFVRFRRFLGLLTIPGALWLIVSAPAVGVLAKNKFNPASLTDRSQATLEGLHSFVDHPLGTSSSGLANVAINLIAAVTLIGVPGLVLALMAYLRPLRFAERRVPASVAALPLILTSVVSEPVLDAPMWWILLALAVGVAAAPNDRQTSADGLAESAATTLSSRHPSNA